MDHLTFYFLIPSVFATSTGGFSKAARLSISERKARPLGESSDFKRVRKSEHEILPFLMLDILSPPEYSFSCPPESR